MMKNNLHKPSEPAKGQRAENGGLDPSWLILAIFGAPRFSIQRPQNTYFKGFWGLWTENRGAPKTPNSTTTDPNPHSRPCEKERRRRRAEKRLSKRVFLESPFLLCLLKVFRTFQLFQEQTLRGQRRNGLSKNTLLDNCFSAQCLLRSFGAL